MIDVEDLLKPVADDKPCGEDFTYHPSLQNLETLFRGKPETQFSPAEDPDWKEVRDAAIEVLGQSKHLTAGTMLAVALLKIGGLDGFRDGLAVVRGLTEKYWGDLYPKLDPEDNNDPTERLNILNNLASSGDPYKTLLHLRQTVICRSPALGQITLQQYLAAKEKSEKSDGDGGSASGAEFNQVQAAFQDAGPEAVQGTMTLVEGAIEQSSAIENFLESTLGAGQGVNFEALNKMLSEIKQAAAPHVGGEAVPEPASAEAAPEGGGAPGAPRPAARGGPSVSGTIQTRADVIKALGLICDYYRTNEPSSPVPLILQRAQRLVDKDFMQIMTDLTPDALAQLQIITGTKPEE